MTTRTANQIKFGIEIECYLPTDRMVSVGGYHNGLQVNWAPDGWNAQHDGSLAAPFGYQAVEIVSPPVAGEEGLAQVWYMVETIKSLGGRVNSCCGLHVHVDANTLTADQVLAVRDAFIKYERAFYGLSGELADFRYGNSYSKASSHSSVDDRYQGCNTRNYFYPTPKRAREGARTIEFRVWAGTLDEMTIVTAVYMAVALVADAERGNVPTLRYNTAASAKKAFVSNVWSNSDNYIVPDEAIDDMAETLGAQCNLAGRMGR